MTSYATGARLALVVMRGNDLGIVLVWLCASCSSAPGDVGGATDTDGDGGPVCETSPAAFVGGNWDPMLLDWEDVGEPGTDTPKAAPYDDILPHHPYLTAVHAAHLPTGELLMYHGQSEQRLWGIDDPASTMRWLPIPFPIKPELCSYPVPPGGNCYPDIFCSGAVLLERGLFVAGGNVTGGPGGGGLANTFFFDPS